MVRQRRKLTRRERTFGLVSSQIFFVTGFVVLLGTRVFSGFGIVTGIYYAVLSVLVAALGYALGVRVAWATDPQRIAGRQDGFQLTARKVPKSK